MKTPMEQIVQEVIEKLKHLQKEMAMQSLSDLGQELAISDEQALVWFKAGILVAHKDNDCKLDMNTLIDQANKGFIGPLVNPLVNSEE
jgi:hypothetical protein